MKKIVILIIAVFLITGCSVKYHVVINEDLTLIEEAKMTGTQELFDNYYKTTKTNVLNSFLEIYQDILTENNYQYEMIQDETPYVLVTRKYENANDFVNSSKLFNDYFEEIKYTEDGNKKKIETTGFLGNDPENSDRFDVKELEISITCPYKVINHTAKELDLNTNTYYFELADENDIILLEYDTSSKFNPNSELYKTIATCLLILLGIWIIIVCVNKKNNKNK